MSLDSKLALTQARLEPGMRLLELGCGTGGTALEHASHVGEVRATGLSEAMLAIAREKAAGVGNVSFEVTAAEAVEAQPGSVDVVLALSLLHLVDDPAALLARIHRWLVPGGLIVTSTPCLAEAAPWLRWIAPAGRGLGLIPALTFFDRAALEGWFDAAGFDVEEAWQPSPRGGVFHIARAR